MATSAATHQPTNIIDFSALCPTINYPISNSEGRNMITTLYFALAATNVPDDTIYNPEENIVCSVPGETKNFTTTLGAGAGYGVVSGNAEVSFDLAGPNLGDRSICVFTEGVGDDSKNSSDVITLARARELLYLLLTKPNANCETCGRIPLRYPEVEDGSDGQGGILKIDVRSGNNCLGKCVGPNSFSTATPTPSASSAAVHIKPSGDLSGSGFFAVVTLAWLLGVAMVNRALPR